MNTVLVLCRNQSCAAPWTRCPRKPAANVGGLSVLFAVYDALWLWKVAAILMFRVAPATAIAPDIDDFEKCNGTFDHEWPRFAALKIPPRSLVGMNLEVGNELQVFLPDSLTLALGSSGLRLSGLLGRRCRRAGETMKREALMRSFSDVQSGIPF